jgi:hypothetical protein
MTKEIAKKDEAVNALIPTYNGETSVVTDCMDEMGGSDFLPRLQLMTDASALVKGDKFTKNHYGLHAGGDPKDLGKDIDIIVCSVRAKALDTGSDDIMEVFDINSDAFADIKKRSFEKDSGCMYGPEFLVYIPAAKAFATFFCSSKTARNDAPTIEGYRQAGKPCTLGSRFIEGKSFSWWAWKCTACPTVVTVPDAESFNKNMEQFLNPPVKEAPKPVEEPAAGGRKR